MTNEKEKGLKLKLGPQVNDFEISLNGERLSPDDFPVRRISLDVGPENGLVKVNMEVYAKCVEVLTEEVDARVVYENAPKWATPQGASRHWDWNNLENGCFTCGPYLVASRVDGGGWTATALFEEIPDTGNNDDIANEAVTIGLFYTTADEAMRAVENFDRTMRTVLSRGDN